MAKETLITNNKLEKEIDEYFEGSSDAILLFRAVFEEMIACDPDMCLYENRGMLGFRRDDQDKFCVYVLYTPDGFEIKFTDKDERIAFSKENEKEILSCCETAVLGALPAVSMEDSDSDVKLDPSQRRFCKRPAGNNIRLLAPAGSGKTFSILWRCRYIADAYARAGKKPARFLIVSFTKNAAEELQDRIDADDVLKGLNITAQTLNSYGWQRIKRQGKELIVSEYARKQIILHNLLSVAEKYPELKGMLTGNRKMTYAGKIMDMMDLLMSMGYRHDMTKEDYTAHSRYLEELGLRRLIKDGFNNLAAFAATDQNKVSVSKMESVFFQYWKRAVVVLEGMNQYTFMGQKYWANIKLQKDMAEGRYAKGLGRYTHIFVDEFQDINPLDLELIKTIKVYCEAGSKKKTDLVPITIVGDDDQAIFGWRGGTPRYILEPDKYMGMTFESCVLDVNYRTCENLLGLSQKLIAHNTERVEKQIRSRVKRKAKIEFIEKAGAFETMREVCKKIDYLKSRGCTRIALIGRRHVSLFPYQILLSSENAQYYVESDLDIFNGDAMNSLQEILKIVYRAKDNDNDDLIRDAGVIIDKVFRYPPNNKSAIMKELKQAAPTDFKELIRTIRKVSALPKEKASQIADVIDILVRSKDVNAFMLNAIKNLDGLQKDFMKADIDEHYKEPQFANMAEPAKKYKKDFRGFYRDIERTKEAAIQCRGDNGKIPEEGIFLMTATRAKGREFDAVIVLCANETEWPAALSDDIEEERRLFYVAMTRAKQYLYFSVYPDADRSRFLEEMMVER